MERKTFLVRLEGEHGGNWCSISEHSRGSVFVLGFEKDEVGWMIEHFYESHRNEESLGVQQKVQRKILCPFDGS